MWLFTYPFPFSSNTTPFTALAEPFEWNRYTIPEDLQPHSSEIYLWNKENVIKHFCYPYLDFSPTFYFQKKFIIRKILFLYWRLYSWSLYIYVHIRAQQTVIWNVLVYSKAWVCKVVRNHIFLLLLLLHLAKNISCQLMRKFKLQFAVFYFYLSDFIFKTIFSLIFVALSGLKLPSTT